MSKKHKHDDHEEHVDESWLIPYADLLTLLLALFIVLYATNSVDIKKFEQMSQAFKIALNDGGGIMNMPSITQDGDSADKKKKEEEENKDSQNQEQEEQQNQENQKNQEDQMSESELQELIKREEAEFEDLKKKIDAYIEKNGLVSDLETHLNLSQLVITISDNALFAPAQANLKPEARELAVAIAMMLEEYPDYDVVVAGHTDDTPINNSQFRSNWDLSSIRAVRFLDVMLENENIDPKRVSATGYGENHPVAENDTVENKAKNRRVEVSILHTYIDTRNVQTLKASQ
ncbi:flagellar motor protein MotB [Paenibacillus sp. CAU 1782]